MQETGEKENGRRRDMTGGDAKGSPANLAALHPRAMYAEYTDSRTAYTT